MFRNMLKVAGLKSHSRILIRCLSLLLASSLLAPTYAADNLRVAFVHPGKQDDQYWQMTSDFMYAAAKKLDIDLKIYFTGGNDKLMQLLVERLSTSSNRPDYLMLTNHHGLAAKMMATAAEHELPVMLVIEGLTEEELPRIEQKVMNNLVGAIVANYREGAYYMARSLLQKAAKMDKWKNRFSFRLVAINGDQSWPSARKIEVGLLDAVEEFPLVAMDGVSYGNWQEKEARAIMRQTYNKHQEINFIWAASDEMALAALEEAREIQATKDKVIRNQVLTAGMGWTPLGLDALQRGDFLVDYGGTFMLGGWGLVLLKDYDKGHGFPVASRLWLTDVPQAMNQSGLIEFRKRFPDYNWDRINFAAYSKYFNPDHTGYDFSLQGLYDNVDTEMKRRADEARIKAEIKRKEESIRKKKRLQEMRKKAAAEAKRRMEQEAQ